jgi:hypothetical protein
MGQLALQLCHLLHAVIAIAFRRLSKECVGATMKSSATVKRQSEMDATAGGGDDPQCNQHP